MNAKFKQFFEQNGLEVSGRGTKSIAYGHMRGYEVNAILSVEMLTLHISMYATDEQRAQLAEALEAAKLNMTMYELTPFGLKIFVRDNLTVGHMMKRLPGILDVIFGAVVDCGALGRGFCPVCGRETDELRPFNVDGMSISFDGDCALRINAQIEAENEEFEQAPGNYGRGLAGALLGGLAGAAVAAILFYIGYVSSFSALLAVILGAALYTKFGGKRDKIMVLTVGVTSVVCMLGTVFGYYVISCGLAAAEAGADIGAFDAFVILMREVPEIASSFRADMLMMLFFSLLGVAFEIFALARGVKRRGKVM